MASKWLLSVTAVLLILTASCSSSPSELAFGYYLTDGGGSKLSLSRPDGSILISYSVKGIIDISSGFIIEYADEDGYCAYLFVSRKNGDVREQYSKYVEHFIVIMRNKDFEKLATIECSSRHIASRSGGEA